MNEYEKLTLPELVELVHRLLDLIQLKAMELAGDAYLLPPEEETNMPF